MLGGYPDGPASVPENLVRPSTAYKKRVWVAMAGLILFMGIYLAFTVWLIWLSYRLFSSQAGIMVTIIGIFPAFLAAFMIKGLFLTRPGDTSNKIEVTKEQQPRLFEFLHRLADDAKAPRPYRVFLSMDVNAAVFYDLSILNLIWPSKKNLVIGLGLVNCLNLSEFKAVCAHEFGHFTQRSMAVGRWVYMAQQIVSNIVVKRDGWDHALDILSCMDYRIAWIGAVLRLFVWSIRSLLDTLFRGVVIAQRALSREMELQADLVAVSLTGSDALINALYCLQTAEDTWDRALLFVDSEVAKKRGPSDFFAVHEHIAVLLGRLYDDPMYGKAPLVPHDNPQNNRIFSADLVQVLRMWATHPVNHEREENAKRYYLAAPLQTESAWDVFDQQEKLRKEMSAWLLPKFGSVTFISVEETLLTLNEQFNRIYYDHRYRGIYLGRSPVIFAHKHSDLYDVLCEVKPGDALKTLYPTTLSGDLEKLRSLEKELRQLEALRNNFSRVSADTVYHRGRVLRFSELSQVIEMVRAEIAPFHAEIVSHERLCRTVHRVIAVDVGKGWEEYLVKLAHVLHYATHAEANLQDIYRYLAHMILMKTATNQVSKEGMEQIVKTSVSVYRVLQDIYKQSESLVLDQTLQERFGRESMAVALKEFTLPCPEAGNIESWLRAIDSWVEHVSNRCEWLKNRTLEQLLVTEARLARHFCQEEILDEDAPSPSAVPEGYAVLPPGQERKHDVKLGWWERFQIVDGPGPRIIRFAMAGGIVGVAVSYGMELEHDIDRVHFLVYNGLLRDVQVVAGETSVHVKAASASKVVTYFREKYQVTVQDEQGNLIENAEYGPIDRQSSADMIYNIAGASPLIEWTAVYGNAKGNPPRLFGAPQWFQSNAFYLFEEPPPQLSVSRGGETRRVLNGLGKQDPAHFLNVLSDPVEIERVIVAHARWDVDSSPYIIQWLAAAAELRDFPSILADRLERNPREVVALRLEQDMAQASQDMSVCQRQKEMAEAEPDNIDLRYLAVRCLPDEEARDRALMEGYRQWPQNVWFANAAGYVMAGREQWDHASQAWEQVIKNITLRETTALELARVRRMQGRDTQRDMSFLTRYSRSLRFWLASEGGEFDDISSEVYPILAQGKLADAVTMARIKEAEDEHFIARTIRLAAASDAAPEELIAEALALQPDQGVDSTTIWMALALSMRENRDFEIYRAKMADFLEQVDATENLPKVDRFLAAIRAGKIDEADAALAGVNLRVRGFSYSMGLIVLGRQAPDHWRKGARALLFVGERPWFSL